MRIPKIPQYEAKGYVDGFEPKAQELFSNCFDGRQFDRETWNWQFIQNPIINKRITTLWDKDVLVALTALTPAYAIIHGERILCAISGTTMARDDYRGVSIQLIQECTEQNKDIEFKYSFPNKQAFRIATQYYGHHYVGDIAFWSMVPERRFVNDNIRCFQKFDSRHEVLFHKAISRYAYIKDRNIDYMNWRFVDKPHIKYELYEIIDKGYIVFDTYSDGQEKHLQIVDILAIDIESFIELCQFAINEASKIKADLIKLWMTSINYSDILSGLGFSYGIQPFRMTVWDRDISLEESYITMMDSDVF